MNASTARTLSILCAIAAVLSCSHAAGAGDQYVARRGVIAAAAPAARIGRIPTVEEAAHAAVSSTVDTDLAIVSGQTAAGGLTVELDRRFTTQVRVGSGPSAKHLPPAETQCSVVLHSVP